MEWAGVRYRLDADDRIRDVDAAWCRFAQVAEADGLARDEVLGRPLWEFIADPETVHLYELMFASVRRDARTIEVSFRCDSATERRFMTLRMEPVTDDGIDLTTRIDRREAREPVALLDPAADRSAGFRGICSWCKRVRMAPAEWVEVEVAVERLGLFDGGPLPSLTHGVCEDCEGQIGGAISE